jgi:nucleoside-diphosphate-sugar epimerase
MKVMVTGGAGYIGRVLVPKLLERGYDVTVLDRLFLNYDDVEKEYSDLGVKLIKNDTRFFDPNALKGIDAVVDLAALSNDPVGDLDQLRTWDINYIGRVRVARLAKKIGIEKYVLTSSCSVYGFLENIADENTPTNPLTTYAEANVAVERDNLLLKDEKFTPTALRLSTAFGYSKKMRLDIAINAMTYYAFHTGKVRLMRDGNQFRPFVHVNDISEAIIRTMESDKDLVSGKTYNIGADELNVKLRDLAEIVKKNVGIQSEIEWYGDPDVRSYKVSFAKSLKELDFKAKTSIEDGVREILEKLKSGELKDCLQMHTVNYYKSILDAKGMIDRHGLDLNGIII